jgi:DNA modification methylase
MNIQTLPLSQLLPAEYNPRRDLQPGDADYDKLQRSIAEFGCVELPVWNERTGNVVSGHQRLKVLQSSGITETPCVVVALNLDQEKSLNLAMNKIGGSWDEAKLAALLDSFSADFDATVSGFDADEISALLDSVRVPENDDFDLKAALEEIADPVTKPGDLWKLGRHRLLCGDSTKSADIARLMCGEQAQLIITDPPYNVNYHTKAGSIANDNMSNANFYAFLLDAFKAMHSVTAPGASAYVFHADTEGMNFRRAFADGGFELRQVLVWVKNHFALGRQDYQWRHEPCLYGWMPGAAHYFADDRSQSTVVDDAAPPDIRKMSKAQLLEFAAALLERQREAATTVLRCDKPQRSDDHPTMKPVELVGRLMRNSSKPEWLVLDPFGGSGTTLITAEKLRRRARLCELDPRFCDVIVRRWEAMTGDKATLMK